MPLLTFTATWSAPALAAGTGTAARIVVIQPKPGQAQAFEEGYKRHLEWHRAHADAWVWHGWSFVLGPRLGQFMDGTFGHEWTDFDAAVDPPGDAADNAANVTPYADFLSHGAYELLPALSSARLPDRSRFLELTTYEVRAAYQADFELAVQAAHRAHAVSSGAAAHAWYRLVSGGPGAQYLLLRPLSQFSQVSSTGNFFLPVLGRRASDGREPIAETLARAVSSVGSELLRHRPDMSYEP